MCSLLIAATSNEHCTDTFMSRMNEPKPRARYLSEWLAKWKHKKATRLCIGMHVALLVINSVKNFFD